MNIENLYVERHANFYKKSEELARQFNIIANIRFMLFASIIVLLFFTFQDWPIIQGGYLVAAIATTLVFFGTVLKHDAIKQQHQYFLGLSKINQQAISRGKRDWENLEYHPAKLENLPSFAKDLDVFGKGSLFHLANSAYTSYGKATLRDWFLHRAAPDVIKTRQQAVKELTQNLDFIQQIQIQGVLAEKNNDESFQFLEWAKGNPWLSPKTGLIFVSYVLPLLTIILGVAKLLEIIPTHTWATLFLVNILLAASYSRKIKETFNSASRLGDNLENYAKTLKTFTETSFESDTLKQLQQRLQIGNMQAYQHIENLSRIVQLSDLRYSSLYIIIQGFTLWDFHIIRKLETWQKNYGQHAQTWLEILGEIEALSSLAALAHCHPHWIFPEVNSSLNQLSATEIRHPLITPEKCVANDIEIGPQGSFLLVTGSNMSGKSTFLRTLGTNIILAQAGGPVCAKSMKMPSLELVTTMRVQDSLSDGASFFMAELQQLKKVVDVAKTNSGVTFYLLDEILQGTNTSERQIAVRRVLSYLLALNTLGAISTHDLDLAQADELQNKYQAIHFKEKIEETNGKWEMTFDYKIRSGIATSTNALKLLDLIGLTQE